MTRGGLKTPTEGLALADALRDLGLFDLAARIARDYQVDLVSLLRGSRVGATPHARAAIATVLRSSYAMSYPQVADLLGIDHTTVISAIRRHEDRLTALYNSEPRLSTVRLLQKAERPALASEACGESGNALTKGRHQRGAA